MTGSTARRWRNVVVALVILQTFFALATFPWYRAFGLSVDWRQILPAVFVTGTLVAVGVLTRNDRVSLSPALIGAALLLTFAAILAPSQYLAVSLRRPLIDAWLTAMDARLGVSVPAISGWIIHHPWLVRLLGSAYLTLLPQFILPILLFGIFVRDSDALAEFLVQFHVCALIVIGVFAVFPSSTPFDYLHAPSALDQSRFLHQFPALRAGTLHVIDFRNIEGLVSFPSFHVAGALMVTWTVRRVRPIFYIVATVNALLIASTVLLGVHYAIDVVAAVPVWLLSVLLYRSAFAPSVPARAVTLSPDPGTPEAEAS